MHSKLLLTFFNPWTQKKCQQAKIILCPLCHISICVAVKTQGGYCLDTKVTEATIFQELASTVGKQKGEAAMNLSDVAAGFVIQTVLGFSSRTYTNILVLPLAKFSLQSGGILSSYSIRLYFFKR